MPMELDQQVCSRARITRDARFDGRFFIGVLSTGIYCRPICPSRTSKERNVRYFPSASAAAEAGFRPCLRCRPECSPGTPAWLGTPNTVLRALRLIDEGSLEDGGVELLAERLGVGSRHLRRLFLQHLGATPSAVAQTRRLHFAKKLIDETSLPMSQVAIAAGFGCVRRFNASISRAYERTPTQIRALAKKTINAPENQYTFHLPFRPPYHWEGMLAFLRRHAIPGVEAVSQSCYRRAILLNGSPGHFEISLDDKQDGLVVRLQFGDPRSLFFIIERIRNMFDLNADWVAIANSLRSDPILADAVAAEPGLRVPGCWDGFEIAVRSVVNQQFDSAESAGVIRRIVQRTGRPLPGVDGITHLFPTPQALAECDLMQVGLARSLVETIRNLARAVSKGQIRFERSVEAETLITQLSEMPGISRPVARYVAMRALGEPDSFPSEYLDLHRALRANPTELEHMAEDWRPWRAYAAMYVWRMGSREMPHPVENDATSVRHPSTARASVFLHQV